MNAIVWSPTLIALATVTEFWSRWSSNWQMIPFSSLGFAVSNERYPSEPEGMCVEKGVSFRPQSEGYKWSGYTSNR